MKNQTWTEFLGFPHSLKSNSELPRSQRPSVQLSTPELLVLVLGLVAPTVKGFINGHGNILLKECDLSPPGKTAPNTFQQP